MNSAIVGAVSCQRPASRCSAMTCFSVMSVSGNWPPPIMVLYPPPGKDAASPRAARSKTAPGTPPAPGIPCSGSGPVAPLPALGPPPLSMPICRPRAARPPPMTREVSSAGFPEPNRKLPPSAAEAGVTPNHFARLSRPARKSAVARATLTTPAMKLSTDFWNSGVSMCLASHSTPSFNFLRKSESGPSFFISTSTTRAKALASAVIDGVRLARFLTKVFSIRLLDSLMRVMKS